MKRLSGWARLWLVFAIAVWLIGAWSILMTYGVPPPGSEASAEELCLYQWRRAGYPVESIWMGGCAQDQELVAFARSLAPSAVSSYWYDVLASALGWLAIPFALAGVWKIGRWIQRGFKQEKPS